MCTAIKSFYKLVNVYVLQRPNCALTLLTKSFNVQTHLQHGYNNGWGVYYMCTRASVFGVPFLASTTAWIEKYVHEHNKSMEVGENNKIKKRVF